MKSRKGPLHHTPPLRLILPSETGTRFPEKNKYSAQKKTTTETAVVFFYDSGFDTDYLSMVSMVRCVLVNTQISAAMAMDSFTISAGVMDV